MFIAYGGYLNTTVEVSPVYPTFDLALAIQADREREIRKRLSRVGGVPSGPRHPHRPDAEQSPALRRQPVSTPAASGSR